jgi:Flp pilus assembly protein TadD
MRPSAGVAPYVRSRHPSQSGCCEPNQPTKTFEDESMKQPLLRIVSAVVLALAAPYAALAADTTPPAAAAPDPLGEARALIKAKKWTEAVAELQRVNLTSNADWNNLMGYSIRRGSAPDLDASERYYNEALRIDPKHRGALEYSGQLYLMKGDLASAEKRLAVLDKACTFGCDEYTDLKKAIERYKAAGNKYVAYQ